MSNPARSPVATGQTVDRVEEQLLSALRESLLLLNYRRSRQLVDHVMSRVIREMWSGWGLTQAAIGETLGLTRGRVQQILAQPQQRPDLTGDGHEPPNMRLVVLTVLSATRSPLSHEEMSQRVQRVLHCEGGSERILRETFLALGQLVQSGTVRIVTLQDGAIRYRLASEERVVDAPVVGDAHVQFDQFRERVLRHLEFHDESVGRVGIGPRVRQTFAAHVTKGLSAELTRALHTAVREVLADFEERALADGEAGPDDPEFILELFLVGSNIELRELPGEAVSSRRSP